MSALTLLAKGALIAAASAPNGELHRQRRCWRPANRPEPLYTMRLIRILTRDGLLRLDDDISPSIAFLTDAGRAAVADNVTTQIVA